MVGRGEHGLWSLTRFAGERGRAALARLTTNFLCYCSFFVRPIFWDLRDGNLEEEKGVLFCTNNDLAIRESGQRYDETKKNGNLQDKGGRDSGRTGLWVMDGWVIQDGRTARTSPFLSLFLMILRTSLPVLGGDMVVCVGFSRHENIMCSRPRSLLCTCW